MDQELMNTAPRTLYAAAGGVMRSLTTNIAAPALVDLTYRSNDPFVVELALTTFVDTHAESATWIVGRDLIGEALASGQPRGDGDFAVRHDDRTDRVQMLFTDGSDRNPHRQRNTHRLVIEAGPVRNLIRHSYLLVPNPQADIDGFLDEVLGSER